SRPWNAADNATRETIASRLFQPASGDERTDPVRKRCGTFPVRNPRMRTSPPSKVKMLGVDDVRETNEIKLLHIIRDRQPISRVDLVKATGLRAGTVSVIVNRLLRASVVHEGELAPSSGGRPATYLQINAEKAHVVGISI